MGQADSIWDDRYKQRPLVAPFDFAIKAAAYLRTMHGPTLLDIGCGDGRDAHYFVEQGINVTGIDFSQSAIERVFELDPRIDARVMNILAMDFPDESFHVVYAHLSLHYFDDKTTDKIIANIYRMLKPDGYFFIRCKSIDDPMYGIGEEIERDMFKNEYPRHFFSLPYLQEKLKNFNIIESQTSQATFDGHESKFVQAIAQK